MLIGNYSVLNKSPLKFTGGSVSSAETTARSNFGASGNARARLYVDQSQTALRLYAVPSGNYAGTAYFLPQRQGDMASRNMAIGLGDLISSGALGRNVQAALTGSGDVLNAVMQLVVSAVATLSGSGALTGGIVGKLEAVAVLAGAGNLQGAIGAIASMLASVSGAGNLSANPRAVGEMAANIRGYGELTPEGIKDAVWGALAASNNTPGTMGNKVNSAASGGVDYTALGQAVWASATRTLTTNGGTAPTAAEVTAAVLAALQATTIPVNIEQVNGQTINGTGTEANPWGP